MVISNESRPVWGIFREVLYILNIMGISNPYLTLTWKTKSKFKHGPTEDDHVGVSVELPSLSLLALPGCDLISLWLILRLPTPCSILCPLHFILWVWIKPMCLYRHLTIAHVISILSQSNRVLWTNFGGFKWEPVVISGITRLTCYNWVRVWSLLLMYVCHCLLERFTTSCSLSRWGKMPMDGRHLPRASH